MGILDLPNELLHDIFSYLEDQDVFNGRLSNKSLEHATLAHFGKRFFRKKGFMITSPSINVLLHIAASERLRKYGQHIWFNPDCFTFVSPACAQQCEASDSESDDELDGIRRTASRPVDKEALAQYEAYQACIDDHEALLWQGVLEQNLAMAFKSLPNLMTIGMRRSEDYSPYGWRALKAAVGEDPRVLGPIPYRQTKRLSGSTQLFVAVLQAAASSSKQIQRLYTDAVEFDNISHLQLPETVLIAGCESILYLELNAVKGWVPTDKRVGGVRGHINPSETFVPGSGLVRLFSATPNLKELGLQIFSGPRQSHLIAPIPKDPESWRQSYPYLVLANIAANVSFRHLTRMKLEKVPATAAMLQNLFKPCAAVLTSMKLRDIRLLPSTMDAETERPWSDFFAFLVESCPSLSYVLFQHLMHARGGVSFQPEDDLPAGDGENENSYLIDHVPESHGGTGRAALFVKFDRLILEVSGLNEVNAKLTEVVQGHWYCQSLFSYAMDEMLWCEPMESGNRVAKTFLQAPREPPRSKTFQNGAAMAALQSYGNGIGRTGNSSFYDKAFRSTVHKASNGHVETDKLSLIAAGRLAGMTDPDIYDLPSETQSDSETPWASTP
ncbi:uncharacterized protein MYCGRDRAFT_95089 [Zymoseptoria tritici IPO323]|uniref:F-box domain-containing protein n=1 Tax=Zymoseptoria tritici (strain CBS 115943 / IPO323) TaxID=336722 RepID=F9XH98_ZYMTI|nr:uncharacterized protein MYCGRDRAFT_95089 [Zymoseptoria tritici IPO323]EGP85405.1 hypothetical protein MYCGRDRAFT_95089 [Zymoseptoria tritici IPO323]